MANDDRVLTLFNGMSKTTKNFLISQLRCAKKSPKGRRWTMEDKCFTLALFKRNPSGYNFLKKLVTLPTKRTILSFLGKVPFSAGMNPHIFEHIDSTITNPSDRNVALLFDEMDIKEHLWYDNSADKIVGYEDFGKDIAGRALFASTCLHGVWIELKSMETTSLVLLFA